VFHKGLRVRRRSVALSLQLRRMASAPRWSSEWRKKFDEWEYSPELRVHTGVQHFEFVYSSVGWVNNHGFPDDFLLKRARRTTM
jgi:hypothetical protein